MILLHELAHVKRSDLVWVYVSLFVGAIYWFNPLAWIVRRKLTIESDKACDDYVVCAGADKLAYAQHLLVILRSLRRNYAPVPIGVGMARRTQMEGRLMSILSDRKRVAGVRRSLVVWTTALTLFLLLPLAIIDIQAADPAGEQPAQKDASLKEKQLQAKESEGDWPSPNDSVVVDVLPEMIFTDAPVYPEEAKKAGITGDVWVKALVDKDGAVRKVLVHKSSGNEQLDKAAAKAATGNKFKPAVKDGRPVPVWISYKISFVLDDEDSGKSH